MSAHSPRSIHLRLAFAQFAVFVGLGIYLPFWPFWLKDRGFDEEHIGLLIAGPSLFRILLIPFVASFAERTGAHRGTAIGLLVTALLALLAADHAYSFLPLLVLLVAFYGAFALVFLLLDHLSLSIGPSHGISYGRVRLFGSFGFLLANVLGGKFLDGAPAEYVHHSLFATIAFGLLAVLGVPRGVAHATAASATLHDAPSPAPATRPKSRLPGALFLLAVAYGLIQASHGAYYVGASLSWRTGGFGEDTIGFFWAIAVLSEIGYFAFGASGFRFGVYRWLLLGAAMSIARWWLHPHVTTLPAVLALQLLHAFTFGATHLAGLQLMRAIVPEHRGTTAQGALYLVSGTLGAIAMALAGRVMEKDAVLGFHAMALVGGLGLIVAVISKPAIDRAREVKLQGASAPGSGS